MPLKETVSEIRKLLAELSCDLEKAARGNRAAAQRVRTGSITFARVAKEFRKESVAVEKGRKKALRKASSRRKD